MEGKAVYVYLIKDNNGSIVYCGSTSMSLRERYYHHISNKKGALYELIQKNGKTNYQIEAVARCVDKESAYKVEEMLTRYYKDKGEPLQNEDYGNRLSEAHKKKISEANKGRIHTETRKPVQDSDGVIYPCIHIAAALTGAKRQNIGACLSGRRKSAAGRRWSIAR